MQDSRDPLSSLNDPQQPATTTTSNQSNNTIKYLPDCCIVRADALIETALNNLSRSTSPLSTTSSIFAPHQNTVVSLRQTARALSRVRLSWHNGKSPESILIVCKDSIIDGGIALSLSLQVKDHLISDFHVKRVDILEAKYNDNRRLDSVDCCNGFYEMVITLGGDGTVLHAAWLFQTCCPPILPLYCGTLGFLTIAPGGDYTKFINQCIIQQPRMNIRMRLQAEIVSSDLKPFCAFTVLNDIVIDRGSQQHVASLDIYGDGILLTTLTGDGIIIATPTGCTAYSMSAGGSMVHPDLPSISITPICPHSLSFRPIVLPDWMEIKLVVNSPKGLNVSFDGREQHVLSEGGTIIVRMSEFPVSTVCASSPTVDWLHSLSRCLSWNQRSNGNK